jgi:hypothetical protein
MDFLAGMLFSLEKDEGSGLWRKTEPLYSDTMGDPWGP